jgi:sugar phosphate isomerase/epimerase
MKGGIMFYESALTACQILLVLVAALAGTLREASKSVAEAGPEAGYRDLPGTASSGSGRTRIGLTNPFYVLHNGVDDEKHPTQESRARMLKELGYAGMSTSGVEGIPELLAALDRHGLKLFTIYVGANLDPDKPKYDPRLLDGIKLLKGRETMIWLYIQSTTFKPSSVEGDPRAVEIVRELADAARESGLKVALYPHVWFWVERVEDAVRVVRKAGRDNVGVTFNLCHWLKVDSVNTLDERLRLAMPHLFQVTINGADPKGDWDRLIQPLGCGSYDVRGLIAKLRQLGYIGPVGLQCYNVKGDKYENLKRSMAAWQMMGDER